MTLYEFTCGHARYALRVGGVISYVNGVLKRLRALTEFCGVIHRPCDEGLLKQEPMVLWLMLLLLLSSTVPDAFVYTE